ncbi:hypothetical protein OB03_04250, partial [Brevundimonas sp. GN22]
MADDLTPQPFLGFSRSMSGRNWRMRPADPTITRAHMQTLGLGEALSRALASREVAADDGPHFLNPTLRALFPDPSSFMDMDKAAN